MRDNDVNEIENIEKSLDQNINPQHNVSNVDFNPNLIDLHYLSTTGNKSHKQIILKDTDCWMKQALFKALKLWFTHQFDLDAKTTATQYFSTTDHFVKWLNDVDLDEDNRNQVLNQFNNFKNNEHIQKNGKPRKELCGKEIQTILNQVLSTPFLSVNLQYLEPHNEEGFLKNMLDSTKGEASQKEQYTLSKWVGSMSWLRDDIDGIGATLYHEFIYSEKVILSLQMTFSTALKEFLDAKKWLKTFLKDAIENEALDLSLDHFDLSIDKKLSSYQIRDLKSTTNFNLCVAVLKAWQQLSQKPESSLGLQYIIQPQCFESLNFTMHDDEKLQSWIDGFENRTQQDNLKFFRAMPLGDTYDMKRFITDDDYYFLTSEEEWLFACLMASYTMTEQGISSLKPENLIEYKKIMAPFHTLSLNILKQEVANIIKRWGFIQTRYKEKLS